MHKVSTFATAVSVCLFGVAGALVFAMQTVDNREIASVFALILGVAVYQIAQFLFVAANGYIRSANSLDYDRSVIELARAHIKHIPSERGTDTRSEEESVTPDLRSLFFEDANLALAKLRMDLEHELRMTATFFGLPEAERAGSLDRLTNHLYSKSIVSASVDAAVREIADVCNKAIHGYEIESDEARSILSSGEALVAYIRSLRSKDRENA